MKSWNVFVWIFIFVGEKKYSCYLSKCNLVVYSKIESNYKGGEVCTFFIESW